MVEAVWAFVEKRFLVVSLSAKLRNTNTLTPTHTHKHTHTLYSDLLSSDLHRGSSEQVADLGPGIHTDKGVSRMFVSSIQRWLNKTDPSSK